MSGRLKLADIMNSVLSKLQVRLYTNTDICTSVTQKQTNNDSVPILRIGERAVWAVVLILYNISAAAQTDPVVWGIEGTLLQI